MEYMRFVPFEDFEGGDLSYWHDYAGALDAEGVMQLTQRYFQVKNGVRIAVPKELSDELLEAECANLGYEDIVWPAASCEINFEDASLPAVLITKADEEFNIVGQILTLKSITVSTEINFKEMVFLYMTYFSVEGMTFQTFVNKENVKDWLCGALVLPRTESTSKYESLLRRRLFRLIVKLFLYMSIAEHRGKPVFSRGLKKYTGLRKKKLSKLPCLPMIRPIIVPSVVYGSTNGATGEGPGKAAHKRRGHFRRCKNAGIVYVKPALIHGGGVADRVYVARKQARSSDQ